MFIGFFRIKIRDYCGAEKKSMVVHPWSSGFFWLAVEQRTSLGVVVKCVTKECSCSFHAWFPRILVSDEEGKLMMMIMTGVVMVRRGSKSCAQTEEEYITHI